MSAEDAAELDVEEGQQVVVESVRGSITVPVRCTDIRRGSVFIPFHYGDLSPDGDQETQRGLPQAANELTITAWDPVSKQPQFKGGAVRVRAATTQEG
jgi:anaerobic selenocysteine-containing dehydrogenase